MKEGDLASLNGAVGNLNVAVSPGVYLQSIGFGWERNPLALSGTVGFSAGPSVAGKTAVSVNGTFKAKLADPLVFEVNGNAKLADKFSLGNVFMRYSSNGLFELGGKLNWDLEVAYVNGEVNGFVDGLDAAELEGQVQPHPIPWAPDPCAGGGFIVSNLGIAACVDVYLGSVGVGYEWGGDFDLWWGSCDLGPGARPTRKAPASPRRTASSSARAASAAFAVEGVGGAHRRQTLTGPHGKTNSAIYREAVRKEKGPLRRAVRQRHHLLRDQAPARRDLDHHAATASCRSARCCSPSACRSPRSTPPCTGTVRARVCTGGCTDRGPERAVRRRRARASQRDRHTSAATGQASFHPPKAPPASARSWRWSSRRPSRTNLTVGAYRAPGRLRPCSTAASTNSRHGSRLLVSWDAPKQGFRHAVYLRRSDDVRPPADRRRRPALDRLPRDPPRLRRDGDGDRPHPRQRQRPLGPGEDPGAPPKRPAAGTWKLSSNFGYARKGSFSVARRSGAISALNFTPGPSATKACGKAKLLVLGAHKPQPLARFGLATWTVGRHSAASGDGLAGTAANVKQGHKSRHATLKLAFDGPRTGTGEVELKNCRLYFEFTKR